MRQGYNRVHFVKDDLNFWAVSELIRSELKEFVDRLTAAATVEIGKRDIYCAAVDPPKD